MSDLLVSCCMIVKNEEAYLDGCLRSVFHEVDEIILVDTGSTDGTLTIASRFAPKVRIYHYSWHDDFAAARNVSLDRARGRWVLILDADERLNTLGYPGLLTALSRESALDAYTVRIRNLSFDGEWLTGSFTWAIRFFRRIPGIRFEGAVHERVEPFLVAHGASIREAPFLVDHLGYYVERETWRSKVERNLRIALKQCEKNPNDPYALYYLALSYDQYGEKQKALDTVVEASRMVERESRDQLTCFILNLRAKLLLERGCYDEVSALADASLAITPQQCSARLLKALVHEKRGQYAEAIPHLRFVFDAQAHGADPTRNPSRLSMELTMPLKSLKKLLASCYLRVGAYSETAALLEDELHDDEGGELAFLVGVCCYAARQWTEARQHFERAVHHGMEPSRVLPFLIAISLDEDRFDTAKKFLEDLVNASPRLVDNENLRRLLRRILSLDDRDFLPFAAPLVQIFSQVAQEATWSKSLPKVIAMIPSEERVHMLLNVAQQQLSPSRARSRVVAMLALRVGDTTRGLAASSLLVAPLWSKATLSPEDVADLTFHGGILVQAGRLGEAATVIKKLKEQEEVAS